MRRLNLSEWAITHQPLVLFMIHAPLLWAALASPRELAEFAVLGARLRWVLDVCFVSP